MKKIAILIPSRDRCHKVEKLHKNWFEYTDNLIETDCIIILDEDNESTYTRMPGFIYEIVPTNGKRGVVFPLNKVAKKYCNNYEYIGFLGDDHLPKTKRWNVEMYDVLTKNKPFSMVYGNDLIQGENLPTNIIMDSLFIKYLDNMVDSKIQHLFADNYWLYIGKYIDNIHYLNHVIIEHEHYSRNKSELDEMYKILNSSTMFLQGNYIYQSIINSKEFKYKLDNILYEKQRMSSI
jgi:hypothetical protein